MRKCLFLMYLSFCTVLYANERTRVVDENDHTWGVPSNIIETLTEIKILETDQYGYLLGELPSNKNQKIRVVPEFSNSYKSIEIVLPYYEKFIYLPKTRNGKLACNALAFMQNGADGDAALAFGLLESRIDNPNLKLAYRAQAISLSLPLMLQALSASGASVGIKPTELPKFSPDTPFIYEKFYSVTEDGNYYGLNPKVAHIVAEYNKLKGIDAGDYFGYATIQSLSAYTPEALMSVIIDKDIKVPQESFSSMFDE